MSDSIQATAEPGAGDLTVNDLVERVARALCIADREDPDAMVSTLVPTYRGSDRMKFAEVPAWTKRVKAARAAIEAMREPTDAMIEAGGNKFSWEHELDEQAQLRAAWPAAIDAALGKAER